MTSSLVTFLLLGEIAIVNLVSTVRLGGGVRVEGDLAWWLPRMNRDLLMLLMRVVSEDWLAWWQSRHVSYLPHLFKFK